MGKVVHLNDDTHEKAKAYCKEHDIAMSAFVAQLISEGVKKVHRLYPEPVDKKSLPKMEDGTLSTPAVEKPPFWQDRERSS